MVRLAPLLLLTLSALPAQERWDARITLQDKVKVPFSFQFQSHTDGSASAAWGDVKSTSGRIADGKLTLQFPSGAHIEGAFDGKTFDGHYLTGDAKYRLEAAPFCTCGFQGDAGPNIAGVWTLSGNSGGTLTVRKPGDDTFAELDLPGEPAPIKHLFGRFDGLSFALSAFDGTRGVLVDAEPDDATATLKVTVQFPGAAPRKFTASRKK